MTAKIIIKDEINCKLEGLDLTTRRKLQRKFEVDIPHARYLPSVRLGRWNGKTSYFDLGGRTYVKLLEDIVPILVDENYEIELEDHRTKNDFKFDAVTEDELAHMNWPPGHTAEGQPIMLRDYQIEIINKFLSDAQCLQEIATGAGKTIITATLSRKCEPYGRTIVIVPNKDLVKQTKKDYENIGLDVGVYFGDSKQIDKTHTICTWQSLNNLFKNSKEDEEIQNNMEIFLHNQIAIIVDEVHGAKADVLKQMLAGPFSHIPIRWGLTGTIPKEQYEFIILRICIGDVIHKISASVLQDKGVLAECHVSILQIEDMKEFKNYQEELKYLVTNSSRLDKMARLIKNANLDGNTLVLVDRLEAGRELEARIPDSVFLSGNSKSDLRQEHYDEVATAANKIIIATYGIASVGINIPRLFNLVLIEPGKSFVRVIQSIGRGLRIAKDKSYIQIYDLTSTCKYAKRHLTKRKTFYKEANYKFTVTKVSL